MIISTKCRILNECLSEIMYNHSPDIEVLVKFDKQENPIGVMCNKYKNGKCVSIGDEKEYNPKKCIYTEWQNL